MMKLLGVVAAVLLFVIVALGLAITIIPHFLDRIYYRGPRSDHFDGQRFFNPDGDADTQMPVPHGSRTRFLWNQLTGRDGRPAWPKSVAFTPSKPPARVEGERLLVTWIGHATVLIQTQGLNILTDPIWSERTGPFGRGPRRVTEPGVRFEDLPPIDAVLVSHNHYDHMDLPTLKRLWVRDRPIFITSLGNDTILRSSGIVNHWEGVRGNNPPATVALDWGQGFWFNSHRCRFLGDVPEAKEVPQACLGRGAAQVIAVRAHHWGTRYTTDRNRALWSGFVLKLPSGGNIYFAGDTGMGDGRWPAEAASHGPIRLALIPIGAFRFVPGQMAIGSHIGPVDAVEVFRRTGASRAIPIHWGTFRLSYEARDTPPRLLEEAMRCTGQRGFAPVGIGEAVDVAPYVAPAPTAATRQEALLQCLDTPEVRALR